MPKGAVYRRNQVNQARTKGERVILNAIKPVLEQRFKALSRDLRRANLRKRLAKNGGVLYKANDPADKVVWNQWFAYFDKEITNAFRDGAGYVWDAEQRSWISHDYPIFPYDADDVLARYLSGARDATRITSIATDTEIRVNEILADWYKTDLGLPDLISMLEPLFGAARAELIATTEMNYIASMVARDQMLHYGIDKWIWDAFLSDGVTCQKCLDLNIQSKAHPFDVLDPMPPDISHPRCVLPGQTIGILNLSGGAKSFYEGIVVEIMTGSGKVLTVTPNHPVLTSKGWVNAGLLNEGMDVISHIDPQRMMQAVHPNNYQRPALVENVFASLKVTPGMISIPMKPAPEDFNGDALRIKGEVEIVYPKRELGYRMQSDFIQQFRQVNLGGVHLADTLNTLGAFNFEVNGLLLSPNSIMRRFGLQKPFVSGHLAPLDGFSFALGSTLNSIFEQSVLDDFAVNTPFLSEFIFRNAGLIKRDKVVSIRKYYFSGHVYDLSSDFYEFYTCNSIITHNCRCGVYYVGVDVKIKKGGPTSGNFGHAGRPGLVGGSSGGGHGGGVISTTPQGDTGYSMGDLFWSNVETDRVWQWIDRRQTATVEDASVLKDKTPIAEFSKDGYTLSLAIGVDEQTPPDRLQRAGTYFITNEKTGETVQGGYWMDLPENESKQEYIRYTALSQSLRAAEEMTRQLQYDLKEQFDTYTKIQGKP